jgi:hypothetical protein
LALAHLNTPQFLHEYLDYYLNPATTCGLTKIMPMGAVAYLDAINSTKDLLLFINKWNWFIQNKPNWDRAWSCSDFSDRTARVKFLVAKCG